MLKTDVSYGYYFNDYCMGQQSALSAENFEVYKSRARSFLEGVCLSPEQEGFKQEICNAVCAIAEKLYERHRQGNIKNENIDGYSVTYTESGNARAELLEIAALYLGKSGMLYAGVE